MLSRLRSLFGAAPAEPHRPEREHLSAPEWPAVVYAIGDVHGCLTELRGLEQRIIGDAAAVDGFQQQFAPEVRREDRQAGFE